MRMAVEAIRPGTGSAGPEILVAEGDRVVVPDAQMLLGADYVRQGPDLLLVGDGGRQALVVGYFADETPPDLVTNGGMSIPADLAVKLAGPRAPGQVAQAGGAPALVAIGKVDSIKGEVVVRHADGTSEVLAKDAIVYQGDVLETKGGAAVGVVFADRSTFALGEKGRMVLDEMIYDPGAKSGSSVFSVVQGTFSFVSGQIAKAGPDAMQVRTPAMTIGVRGTNATGEAGPNGTEIVLLPGADGNTGELSLKNQSGTITVNKPYQKSNVGSSTATMAVTTTTPQAVASKYGNTLSH
ncbi:MAG: FecR domain-containing protein, partial [Alphaproteobacteria bacterium]|nr:FecR domain-containing protein [Alphaproteobacteria bacterium]